MGGVVRDITPPSCDRRERDIMYSNTNDNSNTDNHT